MDILDFYNSENNITNTTNINTIPDDIYSYGWDFENDDFLLQDGKFVKVKNEEVIKIWAYKALKTTRYKYLNYSDDFGNEFDSLIGQKHNNNYMEIVLKNLIEDTLSSNKYIIGISNFICNIENRKITIDFIINTVYGNTNLQTVFFF